ncbi:MAG: type II secretion system protein GspM [Lysobacterales bacterium]
MATRLAKPMDGRVLAVALLAAVLLVFYLIAIHWWFVAPQLQLRQQMADLRLQQQRYQHTIAQKPEIEKQLAKVRAYEQGSNAFLPETDPNAASAGLIQRLKQAMDAHAKDEKTCQLVSQAGITGGEEELYKHVTVQARLRCRLETVAAIFHELEGGTPYLFIDNVMIYRQQVYTPPGRTPAVGSLDVRFNLTGYLRERSGKAK